MVYVYSRNNCPACKQTKAFLETKGVAFIERNIEQDSQALDAFAKLGFMSVPVVETDEGETWAGHQPSKLMTLN